MEETKTHDDVINEEIEQEHSEAEERKSEAENISEESNTGDKAVDDFLNGKTDELPEGASEITEDEAKALEGANS